MYVYRRAGTSKAVHAETLAAGAQKSTPGYAEPDIPQDYPINLSAISTYVLSYINSFAILNRTWESFS